METLIYNLHDSYKQPIGVLKIMTRRNITADEKTNITKLINELTKEFTNNNKELYNNNSFINKLCKYIKTNSILVIIAEQYFVDYNYLEINI